MTTTMLFRCIASIALLLLSTASNAAIVIVPSAPLSTQVVHIQLVIQYGSEASITSATITRSGNQFVIVQNVDLACSLPAAPILTSDFDVGVLPAGSYQVSAQIQHTSSFAGCGGLTLNQSAAFGVGEPASVPAGSPLSYFTIACLLAIFGIRRLSGGYQNEA
jgi:hypothetical protein